MSNGAQFGQQLIIAKWTELGEGALALAGSKYLRQLVWAAGAVSASLWLQNYLTMRLGVRRQGIQDAANMLSSVFAAPFSFFSTTPNSQIVTRFRKERENVDAVQGVAMVTLSFVC